MMNSFSGTSHATKDTQRSACLPGSTALLFQYRLATEPIHAAESCTCAVLRLYLSCTALAVSGLILRVIKNSFQSALRRVSVFSNKSTNQVALNISGSELQLAAQDVDFSFEGNERMKCQYDGENIAIAFNARFLIEMLNAADGEEVKIELSTPTKAGILKPIEQQDGEELLMLVMPLMLNQ